MSLYGKSQTILSAERTALNFIGYLSGVATLTNQFVEKIKPYKTKIMDTRKTTPGLRELEKMAVRTGGGYNHRFHLQEMVLIKDNHRIAHRKLMSLSQAVTLVKKRVAQRVEVEVDNLQQFVEVLATKPDMILLDNMSVPQLKAAVRLRKKNKSHCLLEASGRIHLGNIRQIAQTGVDRISIGAITHSAVSIDFSMEFKP